MIDVQNISVIRSGQLILEDVSLQLLPGKITVAIGMNGAGKSTLLEALAGGIQFQKGQVLWGTEPLKELSNQHLAKKRAVLSQSTLIAYPLKVHQVVAMGTYAFNQYLSESEVEKYTEQALEVVEMQSFFHRNFLTLSGGEQKRVLLAKCLLQLEGQSENTGLKCLFLDEPTANLDIKQQFRILELVRKLAKERNFGVFMVLHDLNLAAQIADELLMLKAGKLLDSGTPEEVLNPGTIKAGLEVNCIIQKHPVFKCPFVTTLPL
ncbi:MAG: heme ABC transporter ATP-binding protein [Bacteroidota bacterium]